MTHDATTSVPTCPKCRKADRVRYFGTGVYVYSCLRCGASFNSNNGSDDARKDVLTEPEKKALADAEALPQMPHPMARMFLCIRRLEREVRRRDTQMQIGSDVFNDTVKRAERAEADAAAKGEALVKACKFDSGHCVDCGCDMRSGKPHADDCYVAKALSGDAGKGKVLVDEKELVGLRAALERARSYIDCHSSERTPIGMQVVADCDAALDAADAHAAERGMEDMGFTRKDGV